MSLREQAKEQPFAILHLSDSVNDAIGLRSQLRNAGFQGNVIHADELDQVVEQCRKTHPEIILFDLGTYSAEMLEAVVAEFPREPLLQEASLVVFNDIEDEQQVLRLYETGAYAVVTREAYLESVLVREVCAVQERRRMNQFEQLLGGAESRCQKLIDGSSEAVAYIQDGLHVYANVAYLGLLGYNELEDLVDEPLLDLAAGDSAAELKQFLKHGGEEQNGEFDLRTVGGDQIKVSISATPATFDGESCLQLFVTRLRDESAISDQLEYFARRDLLTGLYNRNYFFDQLQERLTELKDTEDTAALQLIEVSNIAELKTVLGTTGIDSLLTEFGKELESIVGGRGIVARHGAYSFLVLLGAINHEQVQELSETLMDFAKGYVFSQGDVSATINTALGFCMVDANSPASAEMVGRVERASNEAALRGANEIEEYKPDLKNASDEEQAEEWSRRLKAALKENRFFLSFQPIVSLSGDREISRYEVFLRMIDEDGQQISPQEFIQRAERGDLIQSIDRWVVLSSLKQITTAARQGERIQLFIRISEQSLRDPEFAKWLAGRLTAVRMQEDLLLIQVRAEMAGYLLKQIENLKDSVAGLGCEVVIDGFGEGNDPFRILDHLRSPIIKISRPLMERFAEQGSNQEMVSDLVNTAKKRSLQVMVPNVEDAATLQILWPMGVDYVQGDFIQGPRESLEFDFSQF